jgi:fucokinase
LTCLFDWSSTPDALLLTVPCSKEETQFCGLVKTSPESVVQEITFTVDDTNKSFDVVGGVVYFQTVVAETLLNIHWRPPLDCCTYIGADNGDPPLQLSLYFDILGPMCKGVSQEAFLSNSYGSSYDITFGTPGKENKDKLGAR